MQVRCQWVKVLSCTAMMLGEKSATRRWAAGRDADPRGPAIPGRPCSGAGHAAVPGFGEDRYVVAGLHLREYDCPQKRVRNVQASTLFTYENADYSMLDRNWRRVGERDPDKTPRYYRVLAFDQAEHEVFKRLCPAGSPAAP